MQTLTRGAAKVGSLHYDGGAKGLLTAFGSLARTDTSAKNLFKLPAGAIPVALRVWTGVLSNAGTTATISVGKTGTGTHFLNAFDVKGGTVKAQNDPVLDNAFASVGSAEIQVTGTYAETGTASSAGGPFHVALSYYLPS